jgi:hypothetical protein
MPSWDDLFKAPLAHVGTLAANTTASGAGTALAMDGCNIAQTLEVIAVGTLATQAVTFTVEGRLPGSSNWYAVGLQQINGVDNPARTASGITLTPNNGTIKRTYQVLDSYHELRVNVSNNSLSGSGAGLTVEAHGV